MSVKKEIVFRVGLVYAFFVLLGFAIVARMVYIQFVQGAKLRTMAKSITYKDITIEPSRGDICAVDGRVLATSVPYFEIRMDLLAAGLTNDIFRRNIDSLSICLSRFFGNKSHYSYKSELTNARRHARNRRYYPIGSRQVNYIELQKIKKFPIFRLGENTGGFIPVQVNKRIKPHSSLAARTIGSVNDDGVAVGIEGAFDHILRGKAGISIQQRVPGNMWVEVSSSMEVIPEDGRDIITTLDVTLQDVAENALRKQLGKHAAEHGSVILMEVKTGDIKAIANLRRDGDGTYSEAFNYAIGEGAEPGSTFKIATLIALLEDGYVNLDQKVFCHNGKIKYYDKTITDSKEGGYGTLTVKEVFEFSSNIGVTELVMKHYKGKEKKFIDRIYDMRLNQPLNLEIKGESQPYIKYPGDKLWSGVSMPMMSIGYELKMAPLQILTLYNAIANNGRMVKPRFVKAVREHGQITHEFQPQVITTSICSKSTLRKVREVLEGVVENGTAKNLKNENYKIAGKTGTAQIARGTKGYRGEKGIGYQASFAGYFPADDPKYSCIVVVNSPSRSVYYGNLIAGPIFKEISDKVYATSNQWFTETNGDELVELPESKNGFKPDIRTVLRSLDIPYDDNSNDFPWVATSRAKENINLKKRSVTPHLVPDVTGMSIKDALFLLENLGLRVSVRGRGFVRNQSIVPGTRVGQGESISIQMSN